MASTRVSTRELLSAGWHGIFGPALAAVLTLVMLVWLGTLDARPVHSGKGP